MSFLNYWKLNELFQGLCVGGFTSSFFLTRGGFTSSHAFLMIFFMAGVGTQNITKQSLMPQLSGSAT